LKDKPLPTFQKEARLVWRLKNIGQPRKIPMKDGPQQTFQKDRQVQAQEHRPELFWVDEEDLLEIKFNVCSGPLVPNTIGKLAVTICKS
jgi:hypothetical protein